MVSSCQSIIKSVRTIGCWSSHRARMSSHTAAWKYIRFSRRISSSIIRDANLYFLQALPSGWRMWSRTSEYGCNRAFVSSFSTIGIRWQKKALQRRAQPTRIRWQHPIALRIRSSRSLARQHQTLPSESWPFPDLAFSKIFAPRYASWRSSSRILPFGTAFGRT